MIKHKKPPVSQTPTFVAQVLTECYGHTGAAAAKLKMTPATVRNYIKRYPECKDAWEDAVKDIVVQAEENLYEFVLNGDRTATLFVLKTLARQKYSEQQPVAECGVEESIDFVVDAGTNNG